MPNACNGCAARWALEQVKGKLPAEIAISIAGEVIATYNAAFGLERKQGRRASPG